MAKSTKLYSSLGPFVVMLYDDKYGWTPAVGAKTEEAARDKARDYRHYRMGETMKIIENVR